MDFVSITEGVVITVLGAVLVGVVFWLFGLLKPKRSLEWFVIDEAAVKVEREGECPAAHRTIKTILIRNRTRRIQKNICLTSSSAALSIVGPSGWRGALKVEDGATSITIPSIQSQAQISFKIISEFGFSIDMLTQEDLIIPETYRYQVASLSAWVLPNWVGWLGLIIFAERILSLLLYEIY